MGLPISGDLVGSKLENEAVKPSCHKAKILQRESLKILPAHKAEGLESLPFLEDYQKNRILNPTKNRRQPTENRGNQKNMP